MRSRLLTWVTRISLVVGVAGLGATIWVVGPGALVEHLAAIGPWFVVLFAIDLASALCDAAVLYYMTRGPAAPSFSRSLVALFAGRAVNAVTPAANVGEALKVSLLARDCPIPRVVAAVLFAGIGTFVIGVLLIAAGSISTPLLYPLPRSLSLVLLGSGLLLVALALGAIVLVRHGMVASLARTARRLGLLSRARFERVHDRLDDIDRKLRGDLPDEYRARAWMMLVASQILQRILIVAILLATGYVLDANQLVVVLSVGVFLTWISGVVPLGVGVAEGSHGVLFAAIGAPSSLGVALVFARRVNQIIFAALGFGVLAVDRVVHHDDSFAPAATRR